MDHFILTGRRLTNHRLTRLGQRQTHVEETTERHAMSHGNVLRLQPLQERLQSVRVPELSGKNIKEIRRYTVSTPITHSLLYHGPKRGLLVRVIPRHSRPRSDKHSGLHTPFI